MSAPPGLIARTELSGEHITEGRAADLSTRNGQRRYLCAELGVGQREARLLIAAYERDVADAQRIGNDAARSDASFLDWLMRQAPTERRRAKRNWQVGEGGGWAVRSA